MERTLREPFLASQTQGKQKAGKETKRCLQREEEMETAFGTMHTQKKDIGPIWKTLNKIKRPFLP